jgi:hypothetical protein
MAKSVVGKNGGTLYPQESGKPGHSPNLGRNKNPFRFYIRELAEKKELIVLKGRLIGDDGNPTGKLVKVAVSFSGALAVVTKAYKKAAKGDAQARKWLTETGWDKTVKLGNDEDSPLGGGFVLVLPENKR